MSAQSAVVVEGTRAFALTHVRHAPGDTLGWVLAAISLLPIAVFVALGTLAASRRDLRTLSFLAGLLANEALNQVLKRLIREPRPHGTEREDAGMPSSHAQFAGFFAVYMVLALLTKFAAGKRWDGKLWALFALLMSAAVCWSRTYLAYHSVPQVAVGAAAGGAMALAWLYVVEEVSFMVVWPRVRNWWIFRFFMIRDYFHVGDLVEWEYHNAHRASMAKRK